MISKKSFSAMRYILSLRHYCLLAKHAEALCTVILGRHIPWIIAEDTSPRLILKRNPNTFVAVRMRGRSQRFNLLDSGRFPLPIIFDLNF